MNTNEKIEVLLAQEKGSPVEKRLLSFHGHCHISWEHHIWELNDNDDLNFQKYEYRVKPENKQRYRVAIYRSSMKNDPEYKFYLVTNVDDALSIASRPYFYKWADDWKEVE